MDNMFLLVVIMVGTVIAEDLHSFGSERLADFERKLDREGLDIIQKMYENDDKAPGMEARIESDVNQITDKSKHRGRRSVTLEQVKAARKTGNREELFLRSSVPYRKLHEIYDPSDIVPISLTLDPPDNTIEKPKLFAVANYRSKEGSYESAVVILQYNETTDNFTVHQSLGEYAPFELESFTAKVTSNTHRNFLAVSGFIEDDLPPGSQIQPKVTIYAIGKPPFFNFTKIQEFRLNSVRAMKYIQIAEMTYLILGMYYQNTRYGRQYSSPSQLLLLRYDAIGNSFHFHSGLPASGISDIECFTVHGKTYLTVASYRDNIGRLGGLSFIYLYNEQVRGFERMQLLSTSGARDIEHFTLANEKYLVIANEATGNVDNKTFNIDSDLYKLSNGRFELIQKLPTYGAVKWKAIELPNCKQDVMLVYSDQRDDVDQVGIYTFSHDEERFRTEQFNVYHLGNVNSSFRPNARALSSYSIQDEDSGEQNLYIIIGATDVTQGDTIYKLNYEVVLTDSPLDAFKRSVQLELSLLRTSLDAVKALLVKAKTTLSDAVTKSGTENITGTKIISNNLEARHADINRLNTTNGSILSSKGNQNVSFDKLKSEIAKLNRSVSHIVNQHGKFMYTNIEQNVTSVLTFHRLDVTGNVVVGGDVNVVSNYINTMNLSNIYDITMANESSIVGGNKVFVHHIATRNVLVSGKANGLDFSSDLVIQGVDQTIGSYKLFTNSLNVTTNMNTSKINGIDVNSDVLFVNRPGVVDGMKMFKTDIVSRNASIDNVNGLTVEAILSDRVTKSTKQIIGGSKTFQSVSSNGNVDISGTVNGINLNELKKRLESQNITTVVEGDRIFPDNITVMETLVVENNVNGRPFPENILLKSSAQTISANKFFENELTLTNVGVSGLTDGMNLSDVVTLGADQEVHGWKSFETVSLTGNIVVEGNHTVAGIDLSSFANSIISISDKNIIRDLTFKDVSITNITITGSINGDTMQSYRDTWDSCLRLNIDQNISAYIRVLNNVSVTRNLSALSINGFSFPSDFAATTGNQSFNVFKTFENNVSISNIMINGTVNGINVVKFNDDVITDHNGDVFGGKTINGNVIVDGTLNSTGHINGLDFTRDLLFFTGEQDITAIKHINVLDLSDHEMKVFGDIMVGSTIDGVDLSELELSGMTVSKNETITGMQCFAKADYNSSIQLINGVDLSALRDDIVTVNTDQIIKSKKIFRSISLERNLNTTSTIDGVDVSELGRGIVLSNKNSSVEGHVIFHESLNVNGNLSAELIDNIDMGTLRDNFVSLTQDAVIANLSIDGSVYAKSLNVSTINRIDVHDIMYRSKNQIVSGFKQFADVTVGNLTVDGEVNGINLTSLVKDVVVKDTDQTITGHKTFKDDMDAKGNMDSRGRVNGIDMNNWDIVRLSRNESIKITGVKTFTTNATIDHITVNNLVNDQNVTSFLTGVVLSKGNFTLEDVVFESGVDIQGDLAANGNFSVRDLINNVDLKAFERNVLKTVGQQNMTSQRLNGTVSVSNLTVSGLVNGLDLAEDLVTKGTFQQIRGLKKFESIKFTGDAKVKKLVNGVNVTDVSTNSLMKYANNTQIIHGAKSFHNVSMDYVRCYGLVDGLNVSASSFVTLHTKQMIYGQKNFTGDFVSNRVNVAGRVADVDLLDFNRSRVLLSGDQTITSGIEFSDDVAVDRNIMISGTVNDVVISQFNRSSPGINETELGSIKTNITYTLANQCQSLTYVKNALRASAYQFDYFMERQSLRGDGIQHAEFFEINNNPYIALSISRNRLTHCTNSMIMLWNATKMVRYQPIATADARKMVFFHTSWNDSYLLVVNYKAGCPGIDGPTELYRWNESTSAFRLVTSLPTTNAVDAIIHKEMNYVLIFICNSNDSLSSWLLTPSSIAPYSDLDDNPVAAHIFNVENTVYLAVASRTAKNASSGFVHVYTVTRENITRVQSIPTKGASSITLFESNGMSYLIVANDHAYSASSGLSTYYLTVDVYSFLNTKFEWRHSIPAYRAYRVSTYKIGSFIYLAIVHFDKSVSFLQFGLELGFQKIDELPLDGVRDVLPIKYDGKRYLFLSSEHGVQYAISKVLELSPSGPDQRKVEMTIPC